jgi:hypothetical protein
VIPTTSYPASASKAAVTDESTPPDIATTTRAPAGRSENAFDTALDDSDVLDVSVFTFMGGNIGTLQANANGRKSSATPREPMQTGM